MPHVNKDTNGAVIVDDRYSPLLVCAHIREVQVAQAAWCESMVLGIAEREYAAGKRVLVIHDATQAKMASAELRKFWADSGIRNRAHVATLFLDNTIVMPTPLLRGIMTAVRWLNPQAANFRVFGTLDAAITDAVRLLAASGHPVKLPRSGYHLPPET